MIYNYLSLPLAIGIVLFDTAYGVSLEIPVKRDFPQTIISSTAQSDRQLTTEESNKATKMANSNYLGLMNAGYSANQKQDYLTALNYFRQALKIQPKDSRAIKAIENISSYSFDLYMQSGYAADRLRNYTTALESFQKALQIKPDSWHAKQAVNNVNVYLAQQPVPSEGNGDDGGNGFNLLLILIGIGAATALSAGVLFYLFKKTGNSIEEEELADLAPVESDEAQSPTVASNPQQNESTPMSADLETNSATSEEDNFSESKQAPNSPQEPNPNSVVASHESLARLDIVPELIQELDKSDRSVRRKAIWELAQRGDSRAMKPLVELMVEVDSQERGLILEAMTQIAGRTLKPMNQAITMSLQDENSQVKQNAIRDLTRVYDLMSQVTKRLSQVAEDSDAQVQETAKWALKKLDRLPVDANWQTDNLTNEIKNLSHNNTGSIGGNNGVSRGYDSGYPLS